MNDRLERYRLLYRQRRAAAISAPLKVGQLRPCARRGAALGERVCKTCRGKVKLKLYACALYPQGVDYRFCAVCKYAAAAPSSPEPKPAGLLDAVDSRTLPPEMVARWRYCMEWGWGVVQHPAEAAAVYRLVADLRPRVFVEIGSESGGTLYLYAGACAEGAAVIAIDDGRTPKCAEALTRTIDKLNGEGFRAQWIQGNSHDGAVRQRLIDALGVARVDFCHIDGDHTAVGVAADWRDYGPLVRPGGMVA
ncbi:MAG: class I SAM-dependent methyltransferase, partial [Pseudomonadota bacterium]